MTAPVTNGLQSFTFTASSIVYSTYQDVELASSPHLGRGTMVVGMTVTSDVSAVAIVRLAAFDQQDNYLTSIDATMSAPTIAKRTGADGATGDFELEVAWDRTGTNKIDLMQDLVKGVQWKVGLTVLAGTTMTVTFWGLSSA